jgi:uncharacterized protein (TIGR03790 family)
MDSPGWGSRLILGAALVASSVAAVRGAIGPEDVLVLYNTASADGIEVANYYAQVHPGVRLLGLSGVTTDEQITDDYYLNVIRPQILPALSSSTDVIVTTKGLPLRICTSIANPGAYTDPFGVNRTVGSGWWRPYSSLESELTRIDVIRTPQQMGDQTYFSQAGQTSHPQPSCNPYYDRNVSFDYKDYYISGYGGMRLTARLDGFTTADVVASINRAQEAYLTPSSTCVVMDDDPTAGIDRIVQLRDSVLKPNGQGYVYDNTTAAITTVSGPVIGYVSHGTNGSGLNAGYISKQLQFQLANGSVFQTYESYNAYSFQPGGNRSGQGLVGEWLAAGGTAGVGHVEEPLNGACNVANDDQLFKMLLAGHTWAEAAWSSMQQLSYVNTVVGDPLMTWKRPAAGAVTYTCPMYVGFSGAGTFTIGPGGTIVASDVRIGDTPGSTGTLNLNGGTLDMSNPGDTLIIGVNGTLNYTSGTLNVDSIEVKGDGANGGKLNVVQLNVRTLTLGPGATVTLLPVASTCTPAANATADSCISYTGTTFIENGLLQINAQAGPVNMGAIVGNGSLGIGDGIHPTTLIAESLDVQSLILGANSTLTIAALPGSQPSSNSTSPVPEPGVFVLLVTGGVLLLGSYLHQHEP